MRPITPRRERLRALHAARRRIEAEIATLMAADLEAERPFRPVPECGTERGYQLHRSNGEAPCDPCKTAHAARERLYYQARKQLREAS